MPDPEDVAPAAELQDDDRIHARVALERRDQDLAGRCAAILTGEGFDVVHVGGRGVDFTGTKRQFEAEFGSALQRSAKGVTFASDPDAAKLLGTEDASVYFPMQPQQF